MLSTEQIADFQRNGYLIIENYASASEVEILRTKINRIIENSKKNEAAIFSTTGNKKTDISYFLESGDKIRCFFEEEPDGNNQAVINKIGHALHDLDPDFERFSYQKKLGVIARQLGHVSPAIIQSQYIFKAPGVGGKVVPHTDSTFLYTEPQTCLGAWIALEDATTENGCLWAIPGSHKEKLQERYVRTPDHSGTEFEQLVAQKTDWNLSTKRALNVTLGTLVLIHGRVVHFSEKNRSKYSRHAYIMHLIDVTAKYPSNNWLQRDLPLRILQ